MRKSRLKIFRKKTSKFYSTNAIVTVTSRKSCVCVCVWMDVFTSPRHLLAVQSSMPPPFLAQVDLAMPYPF